MYVEKNIPRKGIFVVFTVDMFIVIYGLPSFTIAN